MYLYLYLVCKETKYVLCAITLVTDFKKCTFGHVNVDILLHKKERERLQHIQKSINNTMKQMCPKCNSLK